MSGFRADPGERTARVMSMKPWRRSSKRPEEPTEARISPVA
jgi:hypothetical protein